jgi:hypothetical protein
MSLKKSSLSNASASSIIRKTNSLLVSDDVPGLALPMMLPGTFLFISNSEDACIWGAKFLVGGADIGTVMVSRFGERVLFVAAVVDAVMVQAVVLIFMRRNILEGTDY